jgi:hypothetical protein
MKRDVYCTEECKTAWNDKAARSILDEGKPLVISDGKSLTCAICGASLKVVGTHFLNTHGFDPGHKMSILERQFFFNVPRGTRFATDSMREMWRDRANDMHAAGLLPGPQKTGDVRGDRAKHFSPRVRQSQNQYDKFNNETKYMGCLATHERACVTSICHNPSCAKSFTHRRSQKRAFCSHECYWDSCHVVQACAKCGRDWKLRRSEVGALKNCQECRKTM